MPARLVATVAAALLVPSGFVAGAAQAAQTSAPAQVSSSQFVQDSEKKVPAAADASLARDEATAAKKNATAAKKAAKTPKAKAAANSAVKAADVAASEAAAAAKEAGKH